MKSGPLKIALLIACGALTGCASRPPAVSAGPYETVGAEPRRDTDTAADKTQRADRLSEEGKLDEAEALLKEALQDDVTYGPAHNNLGKLYFRQGKMYLAAWEFQYAAKVMQNHPEPKNNLGLVLESVGKLDEAVEQYGRALELEADNAELVANLARCRVRRGDRGPQVRDLLEQVVIKDSRPEWVAWAREKLALLGRR